MESLRAHIAGVGYREVDRVVFPARSMRAEIVHLLAHETELPDGRAATQRREVTRHLEKSNIEVREVTTNLWDAAAVASAVRGVMQEEPRHEYRFNASTGPKTCVIGGFLASMFWPVRLYYVKVDYKAENKQDLFSQYPATGVEYIPTFHAPPPRRKMVEALAVLREHGWAMHQARLSPILQQANIIRASDETAELSVQAAHSQMQSIADSLASQGFAERQKSGATTTITVTEEGKSVLTMFDKYRDDLR